MQIDTRYTPLIKTNSTNSTASSITEPAPQAAIPFGDGFIDMGMSTGQQGQTAATGPTVTFGAMLANSLFLVPYGVGADDTTFTMKVYAWNVTIGGIGTTGLWIPSLLASFTCTLSAIPGIANTDVPAANSFCDAITLLAGNANVSNEIISGAADVLGSIVLDAKGAAIIGFVYSTGGSATSMNCLAKRL